MPGPADSKNKRASISAKEAMGTSRTVARGISATNSPRLLRRRMRITPFGSVVISLPFHTNSPWPRANLELVQSGCEGSRRSLRQHVNDSEQAPESLREFPVPDDETIRLHPQQAKISAGFPIWATRPQKLHPNVKSRVPAHRAPNSLWSIASLFRSFQPWSPGIEPTGPLTSDGSKSRSNGQTRVFCTVLESAPASNSIQSA